MGAGDFPRGRPRPCCWPSWPRVVSRRPNPPRPGLSAPRSDAPSSRQAAFCGTGPDEPARARLSAAVRRQPDAALSLRPPRRRRRGLPVRKRGRRRTGGALQFSRRRSLSATRGRRRHRPHQRSGRGGDGVVSVRRPARRIGTATGRLPAGPPAGTAAVHQWRGRLRRL